jgi:hypothetical protein
MRGEDGFLVMGHYYTNAGLSPRKLIAIASDMHKARQVLAEVKIIT